MKINIKQYYKEFLNHIHFPSFIYYYETNRILGMNDSAKKILGDDIRNVKDIFSVRPKLSKKTLSNGSLILYKQEMNSRYETILIDMEVNVVDIDEKHMCIVFFEYTYKQNFSKYLKDEIPRIYWKNREQSYLGMNESFKNDFSITLSNEEIQKTNFRNIDFMNFEFEVMVNVEELRVIKAREPLYDMLQVVKTDTGHNVFIVNNRIPFFNKNGTVLGLLGVYHLVLDKEEFKKQYYIALKENYDMYEEQVKLNQFFADLLRITQSGKEYNQILGEIFDAIVRRVDIDHINIYKYYTKEKEMEYLYAWNQKKKTKVGKLKGDIFRDLRNVISRELRKNEYILINSGEEEEKFKRLLNYSNIRALLLFRLNVRGNNKAIISFGDMKERKWTPDIVNLLKDVTLLIQSVFYRHSLEQEIMELKQLQYASPGNDSPDGC